MTERQLRKARELKDAWREKLLAEIKEGDRQERQLYERLKAKYEQEAPQ